LRLARLLADPWTLGAGGFIGALAVAGLGLPAAVGIAAGVGGYAVGTAVKAQTGQGEGNDEPPPPTVELPPPGTEARVLYERARSAAADLGEIAASQEQGPLREQAVAVHEQARDTLSEIARIAAQTVVLDRAVSRIDVAQAQRDLLRLEQIREQEGSTATSAASLDAVRSQLAVAARLDAAWRQTHHRLLSTALGLESLVASMAEVVALSSGAGDGDAGQRISQLADGLTGLRQGLAEAEETSRQALSA
jgi:hypothetical protein